MFKIKTKGFFNEEFVFHSHNLGFLGEVDILHQTQFRLFVLLDCVDS